MRRYFSFITIYNDSTKAYFSFENIVKRLFQVNIAVATYEMIDKHIRKLDSDLAKFESEMKVVFNLYLLTTLPRTKVGSRRLRARRRRW